MLGPSGSGKTTLLNLIGALDHAQRRGGGDRRSTGRELTGESRHQLFEYRRKTVSFVFRALAFSEPDRLWKTCASEPESRTRRTQWTHAGVLRRDVGLAQHNCTTIRTKLSGGQAATRLGMAKASLPPVTRCCSPTSRPASFDFHTGVQILEALLPPRTRRRKNRHRRHAQPRDREGLRRSCRRTERRTHRRRDGAAARRAPSP